MPRDSVLAAHEKLVTILLTVNSAERNVLPNKEQNMGLFDFLKNAGRKVADQANLAVELQRAVEAKGVNIQNLNISFANGVATIRGIAPTQKDLELARLIVGNHDGVEKVNDDGLTVAPGASAGASSFAMYTVKSGDTLSKIAKEQLGDAKKYPILFEENRPMLSDPDEIYPGQVLRIPRAA
jgi:nucleoid-associated protein YgaU